MTCVAFVLASYARDVPAGMERATANLAAGLRRLGHRAVVITARWCPEPHVVRLRSMNIVFPCGDDTLRAAIERGRQRIQDELVAIFDEHQVDVAVYVDALWGLGRVMPDHPARKVLAMHVVGHDVDLQPALVPADQVIAPSTAVTGAAADRGYAMDAWTVVPNARGDTDVRGPRIDGPLRVLARLGPEKGVWELLAAGRERRHPAEVVLAAAPFEESDEAQVELLRRCHAIVRDDPTMRISGQGVSWARVPDWLAGASVVIVPSLRETFGLVALEAMSVGTPVVCHDVGNLPQLVGDGGVVVPRHEKPAALWRAADALRADPVAYEARSRAAYYRSRDFRPTRVAELFLKAVW